MMRTTLFAFTWKMILSLLPPSVLPINWYRSRYFLFRRIFEVREEALHGFVECDPVLEKLVAFEIVLEI